MAFNRKQSSFNKIEAKQPYMFKTGVENIKISDFEIKSAYIRDILALKRQYIVFCKPIRRGLVAFCAKNLSIVSKDVENFRLECFT